MRLVHPGYYCYYLRLIISDQPNSNNLFGDFDVEKAITATSADFNLDNTLNK